MCGFIAGKDLPQDLSQLIELMSYRGLPDYKGYLRFGHKDEMQFAHYSLPFVNLDPAVCIQPINSNPPALFVGEIFNYKELGYETDIECAIEEFWKDDKLFNAFHQFDGFWSFVTTYGANIIAATDYLSQKPIYYRTDMEALASEIDILIHLGQTTRDEVFMSNTMKWGYSPDARTPWNEIKQIPPGHYYYKGAVHEYWDWSKVSCTDLRIDLLKATELRLGGQRDVAVLLSGGLDSTIIYGLIKQLGREVTAVHVDNAEKGFANLALHLGDTMHHVKLDDVFDYEALIVHQSPVDLGSVKPQIAMAKKLRELGFYAVMTGDGADELFGGYRRAKEYDSQMSDMFCELPYYHMPKIDRTMMRYTIETRSPFLAPSICKHAMNTPYVERNGEKKVLKQTFADIVPPEILNRDKHPLKTNAIRTNPMDYRIAMDRLFRSMVYEENYSEL
jgi:asparagine synthetase B (glutamine-hydrolysing)